MSDNAESREPRILEYGPQRLIGMGRVVKSPAECHDVWAGENGFDKRTKEIQAPEGRIPYYAICRCAVGAKDGEFEYIAAKPASDDASVPEGMVEVNIPAATYAEFPVSSLSDIGRAWGYTYEWLTAHSEWRGFCDGSPDGCGCIATPSFELYPPDFNGSNGLFIYIPIRRA